MLRNVNDFPSNHHETDLSRKLDTFFDTSEFIKKGPQFDDLLDRKGYLSYIMFTGSSGAGKTTQVTTINDSPNSLNSARNDCWLYWEDVHYTIATRYITRQNRASDNSTWFVENVYIESREKFQELVDKGIIGIWRERDLGSEKVLYGFASNAAVRWHISSLRREAYECVSWLDRPQIVTPPGRGWIIVYSANNDMSRKFDTIPFCQEHKSKFVHVHVQTEDNMDRFQQRSGDVATWDVKQFKKRASDDGSDVLAKSHIMISNVAWQQDSIRGEIDELIKIFAEYNKKLNFQDDIKKTLQVW